MGDASAVTKWPLWTRVRTAARFAMLLLVGAGAARSAESASPSPRVLLIDSYGAESRWSAELAAGIRGVLAAQFPQAGLSIEYMASDPATVVETSTRLEAEIRREHARSRFAAMIAADDAAFAFALAAHDRVLPNVPLVFCGVSDLPPRLRERHRLVTGTVLVHDVSAVMTSALRRHPRARALVVVHDLSATGLAYREQMQSWAEEIVRRHRDMVMVFLSAERYSTPELIEQVRALPLDCLVLLTSWSQDRDGQPQHLDDVLARIARVSPVPVYGVTGAGSGFVNAAARLAEARRQGTVAGTMVVKILQGVPPLEIPIRVMRAEADLEAGVPLEKLPAAPDAQRSLRLVVTHPGSPKRVLLGLGLITLVLQVALIVMLFAAIRRHRALRQESEALRRRLDQVVDCAGLGLFEWDLDTGAMVFNTRYAEALGYLPDQIAPTRAAWEKMVHPDDLPGVLAALEAFLEDRVPSYAVSYRLATRSGTYSRVCERGEIITRRGDGTPARFLGVHLEPDRAASPGGEPRFARPAPRG